MTILFFLSGWQTAYSAEPWILRDAVKPEIENYISQSNTIQKLHISNYGNRMVYGINKNGKQIPLIRFNELPACISLTTPKEHLDIQGTRNIQLTINQVKYKTGKRWDTTVRLKEQEKIDELDKEYSFLLDYMLIGGLVLEEDSQRMKALKMMVGHCLVPPEQAE